MRTSLDELNPDFMKATLAIEDRNFFKHRGVDTGAIIRAAFQNFANGRRISGASTISMQTIRLLKSRPRNFLSKIIEGVHAIRLEMLYSKEDILRMYFELAPYGGNVNGIKAAAWKYYGKSPKDLTLSESALLAGLPQSPSRLRPDRFPERALKRRDRVLASMVREGIISQDRLKLAFLEPVAVGNYPFPFKTPHFAQMVKERAQDGFVKTTIDSNLQQFAESVLKGAVLDLQTQGVTNGAIVIIENRTGKVRALVGSANFFDKEDSGQVNGALALRSPGSALKPFTYALGLGSGLYSTETIIDDEPSRYAEYIPKNYDQKFHGPVTLRDALVQSLNIPAVEVLESVGHVKLYDLLKEAGLTTLTKDPDVYGLSLTLGSPEVKLLELANAYAALARLGVYKPYQVLEDGEGSSRRILSEGAAYLITDILSDDTRLQSIGLYRNDKTAARVAFKTGTSFGQRDAWTFAYNPEYTVGIWLGNFSSRSSKTLVGIEVATPVAFKIFDWMYLNKSAPWYSMPKTVGIRDKQDMYVKNANPEERPTIAIRDKDKPKIVSPVGGAEYFISGPSDTEIKLPFSARPGSGANELYWFLNGQFLSKAIPGEKIFWNMQPGQYQLTCADNLGRSTTVSFVIR